MGNIPDWLNGWKMDGPTLMFHMYLKAKLRTLMKLVTTAFSRLAPRSTLSRDGENERQSGGISTSMFKTFSMNLSSSSAVYSFLSGYVLRRSADNAVVMCGAAIMLIGC